MLFRRRLGRRSGWLYNIVDLVAPVLVLIGVIPRPLFPP
jgi:hypothetical protein